MQLRQLRQISSSQVQLLWADGHSGPVSLKKLRDSCPCAGCKGESVLLHAYVAPPADQNTPGRYELRSAEMVGGYAVKFIWKDGHNLGLYTWELLHSLCECEECARLRNGER